jgi:hypothetical protein
MNTDAYRYFRAVEPSEAHFHREYLAWARGALLAIH